MKWHPCSCFFVNGTDWKPQTTLWCSKWVGRACLLHHLMHLTCFQSSVLAWAFSCYVVKSIATNALPVSASCHVISCELSNSATVTVAFCVGRVYTCSTCQKVSRTTSRTWWATLAPDQPLRGLQRGVNMTRIAGYFDADWGSNFQNFKLQRWWRCLLTCGLYEASRLVFEHLLLKRKCCENNGGAQYCQLHETPVR